MQTKEFIYNTIYNVYTTKIIKNHYYVEIYHPHALLALFRTDCCSKFVRIPATTVKFWEWNWNSEAVYSNVENCNRISNEIHFFYWTTPLNIQEHIFYRTPTDDWWNWWIRCIVFSKTTLNSDLILRELFTKLLNLLNKC